VTALPQLKSMTSGIAVAGVAATLDLSGAMYLCDHDTLVVADLHFEKGSSFARRGSLLPPYDTRETMGPLASAIERYRPGTVIALGDSFHDLDGPDRLVEEDRAALARLQAGRQWIWITGNHDRALPPSIGGDVVEELALGGLALRHEPIASARRELAGHLHPVGKVVMRGRGVRRRCFVTDGERCILPALGAYAGGLNVLSRPFAPLFVGTISAYVLGQAAVYKVDRSWLRPD
jgi:DNA ligase-associated metallophosphoesterase